MRTRSVTASKCGVILYWLARAVMVEMGMASFGWAGGSSSLNFLISHAIGRSRECCPGDARRGSGCPSRTSFWATCRRARSTD